MTLETPNSKHQHPEKQQIRTTNFAMLVFEVSLELGAWYLELPKDDREFLSERLNLQLSSYPVHPFCHYGNKTNC